MQNDPQTQSMYKLIEQWHQSGKTQKQFSQENHIKLSTFIYWVQKHRQANAPDHGFASLTLSQETEAGVPTPKLEIELSSGIVVRIY
ncbi:MAG: hypothetical protein Q8908_08895 [Bacteroidota bacterium]|nr:hypothetical protein [Bacteroidota bacterium]